MEPTPSTPPMTPTPVPEHKPRPDHRHRGFNPWRVFIGLFIVLIGLAFLAQQFGWTWIHVEDIWKLWPVFIILVGLSMLAKGHVINMILSTLLGVVVIVAGVGLVLNGTAHRTTTTKDIAIAADAGVTSAAIHLDMGAAKVVLTGGSSGVVDGTFTSDLTTLTTTSTTANTEQTVNLKMDQPRWWFGGSKNDLNGRVSSMLPLTVDVNSGASDLNLDLSTVKATNVSVDSGAASVTLRLGDLVDTAQVTISAGASSISLTVPKTVGVNLTLDAAASSKNLSDFTKISDNHYQTNDYSASSKKIDLSIHAGASSITVNRI